MFFYDFIRYLFIYSLHDFCCGFSVRLRAWHLFCKKQKKFVFRWKVLLYSRSPHHVNSLIKKKRLPSFLRTAVRYDPTYPIPGMCSRPDQTKVMLVLQKLCTATTVRKHKGSYCNLPFPSSTIFTVDLLQRVVKILLLQFKLIDGVFYFLQQYRNVHV